MKWNHLKVVSQHEIKYYNILTLENERKKKNKEEVEEEERKKEKT